MIEDQDMNMSIFMEKKLINNLDIVNGMKKLSKIYNKPLAAIAIRWILDYIPDSVVITGIKNKEQLKINLESLNWTLSSDDIVYLKKYQIGDIIMNSKQLAWKIRRHAVEMTHLSRGSHIGSILSVADIVAVLYNDIANVDPKKSKKKR